MLLICKDTRHWFGQRNGKQEHDHAIDGREADGDSPGLTHPLVESGAPVLPNNLEKVHSFLEERNLRMLSDILIRFIVSDFIVCDESEDTNEILYQS